MPAYEYKCYDCQSTFTTIATVTEKAKGLTATCRMCGSERVRQFSGISLIGGSNGGQRPRGG